MLVLSFLSRIFSYFSFLVLAGSPYQGREPLLKYNKTKARDSKSSLLDYSIPKCVLTEAYLKILIYFIKQI
jgi:hypothetical protein